MRFGKPPSEEARHGRQRSGIGKLEQEHRAGEDDERAVISERPKRVRRWMRLISRPPAAREIGINVGRSDGSEREKRWHGECSREQKDRAVHEIISNQSHNSSRNRVSK